MNPPCELTVRTLLPNLRILIAKELVKKHGWTQTKTAKKLGVTQAAVSGYLTQEITLTNQFSLEELESVAKSLASEMVMKKLNHSDLINNVCEICLSLRRGGVICHAHKIKIPELEEEKCNICMQLHMSISEVSNEKRSTLEELRCAVSQLENSQEFAELVPEVYTNLVMSLENAKGIADVAGIPGRLVKIRGKVKALMDPEFGVSSHLAKLLLVAKEYNADLNSMINLKYNDAVMGAIKRLNLECDELQRDPAYSGKEDELFRFAHKAFSKNKGVRVIIDQGGFGIEPSTYLLDEDAGKLTDRVLRLSRMVHVAARV